MNIDTGVFSLIYICKYHGIYIDEQQIRHKYSVKQENMNYMELVKEAKELQFKTRYIENCEMPIEKIPMPCILQSNENEFFILAKANSDKALIFNAKIGKPELITFDKLTEIWNGTAIFLKHRKRIYNDTEFGIKWFMPTIIKYKSDLIQVLIAIFIFQVLGIFSPIMTQVVIDKVLVHNSLSTLNVLAIGLLFISIFEFILGIAKTYVFTNTTNKIDVILGARLFEHLIKLPLAYFEARRVGDTIARVKELENIRRFLTGTPLTSILDVLFIFVYIVVMMFYSPSLTGIVLVSIPIFVVLSAVATPMFKKSLDEKFNAGAESQSYLVESVTGINTIKAFAIENIVQRRWESLQAAYTNIGFKTSILSGNVSAIGQFIQKTFDLLILWYGAHLVIYGQISVGQLIAFRMLAGRVSGPVLRLVQIWQDFQQSSISIERIGDIFNTKPEIVSNQTRTRLPQVRGNIKFENVVFRYKLDSPEVIRNVTFNIEPGKIIGIVGKSGSGKSTIAKLIQRIYIPELGKILIDGVNIAIADPNWLRRQIGVVLQENYLFNMSIKDNISIHNPSASIESIMNVAQIAGAHEFILELSEGYDTIVGEKGTGLSGGQKQRIAIARALLNNPRILIFDEATSALDYESERIIQNNMQKICKGRTVLIIAHRLSTLKGADMIMSIDRGRLVEYGKPEELLKMNGLFRYLHLQQEGL